MELSYDFHEYWSDGPERIRVDVNNFKYKINEDSGDYEELKEKYHAEALEYAAYKVMCAYADFCF